jgi:hypothetical protein
VRKKTFLCPSPAGVVLCDECQNERRARVYKILQTIPDLLHGAPETALARAGVLCVGCLSQVGSIADVRRRVGENDRTGSEKIQKIIIFVCFFRNFDVDFVLGVARRETEVA